MADKPISYGIKCINKLSNYTCWCYTMNTYPLKEDLVYDSINAAYMAKSSFGLEDNMDIEYAVEEYVK